MVNMNRKINVTIEDVPAEDIDFDKFNISSKLFLPTQKDIENYLWVLHNQHQGYVSTMADLAIPKLILLAKYYKDLYINKR